jgi:HAD superfamily hydrolase (TIGR01509 family)
MGKKITNVSIVTEIPRRLEQNLPLQGLPKGVSIERFLEEYLNAYYHATSSKTQPLPKVSETLTRLSEKAKLALITMRYVPKKMVIDEMERFGLAKYFQTVLTAMDTHEPKPSPEALIKCAIQLNVEMCKCAIVGDSVADIRAGKKAGTKTVAVLSGIFSRKELEREKPDLILENVNQLTNFVK